MFDWLFVISKFHQQFEKAILDADFPESIIYRNKKNKIYGIKLIFDDNSNGMLWKQNNKFYLNFMTFDTVIKIPIRFLYGNEVWKNFNKKFDNNPGYLDI